MKRKAFKRHRKRCNRLFREWTQRMGLIGWQIDFAYYRDENEYRSSTGASENGAMITWVAWQYMDAKIAVCVPVIAGMTDYKLEKTVVHELCHILVNEMRDGADKHEERVVTCMAQAFVWVRNSARGEVDETQP